jgi:hypothetical protein
MCGRPARLSRTLLAKLIVTGDSRVDAGQLFSMHADWIESQ